MVVDVRLQPRLLRRARSASRRPARAGAGGRSPARDPLGDLVGDAEVLRDVGAARPGPPASFIAVGIEWVTNDQVRAVADVVGQLGQRGQRRVDHRLHEARVVEVVPQLVEHAAPPGRPPATASERFSRYCRQLEYDE